MAGHVTVATKDIEVTALIVDDDVLICDLMQHFCDKSEVIDSALVVRSGLEAVNVLSEQSFDVIFLDYHLPDITGREILRVVPESAGVVMITSNRDFAADSYEYESIVDYLMKPLDFVRFSQAVMRVRKSQLAQSGPLFIKDGGRLVKIDLDRVYYIKSSDNYTQFFMDHAQPMALSTLKELERSLPKQFQRIHRSVIVNMHEVERVEKGKVFIGNKSFSIGETYLKVFMDKLSLLA